METQLSEDRVLQTPVGYITYLVQSQKWWVITACSAVFVAVLATQGATVLFKLVIDSLESGNGTHTIWLVLSYPLLILLTTTAYRVAGIAAVHFSARMREHSNGILFAYVLQHGKEYFSDRQAGAVLSKVSNVLDSVSQFLDFVLWNYFDAFLTFAITAVLLAWVSPWAGLAYMVMAVVVGSINVPLSKRKVFLSEHAAEATTALRGQMVDVFTNADAVRQYVRSDYEKERVGKLAQDLRRKDTVTGAYSEKILLLNGVLFFIGFLTIIALIVGLHIRGQVSIGDVVMVLVLIGQTTYVILFFGQALQNGSDHYGRVREGLQDLFLPHGVQDVPGAVPLQSVRGALVWEDVTFSFGTQFVFKNFTASFPAGQRVGLVGASGAGKSTFVSLLLRQHNLDNGRILIDDQDIAVVTQDSLRHAIAMVPQEPLLFHRSIRENIAYGKPSASSNEIELAAQRAQAHEFIGALSQGYDTMVGERGVKLSGGQKQRIAIARAMLKEAPILILDEATSALDSESEAAIQKALHELMVGKTVIAIAHRLSTLREMDRIIVLENGVIVEDGTHASLVNEGGVYARLWTHQSGGFV